MARELVKIHPKVDPLIVKNSIVEGLKKRRGDFRIVTGAEKAPKKGGCC